MLSIILGVLGVALVLGGLALIYPPAALIVGGLAAIRLALALPEEAGNR